MLAIGSEENSVAFYLKSETDSFSFSGGTSLCIFLQSFQICENVSFLVSFWRFWSGDQISSEGNAVR